MYKIKAKFNFDKIVNGRTIYPKDFVELVIKYKDVVLEVEEEPFGGYELELEGRTFALYTEDLILLKD